MANDGFDNAQTDKEMLARFKEEIEPEINLSERPIPSIIDSELKGLFTKIHNICKENNIPVLMVYDSGYGPVISYVCPTGTSKLYEYILPVIYKIDSNQNFIQKI